MDRTDRSAATSVDRVHLEPPRANRLVEWFMPDGVADPTLAQRYRDTIRIGLGVSVICALYALLQPLPGEFGTQLRLLFAGAVGLNLLSLWAGKLLGQLTIPTQFTLLFYTGVFSFSAYSMGGPTASSLFWVTGLPLMALLTGGRKLALVWAGVALLVCAAFLTAAHLGHEFPNHGTARHHARVWWISTTTLIALAFGQAATYDRARVLALAMLRHANEQLLRARRRVEASLSQRTSFLTNMSHELRTPMAAILGFTEVALDQLEQGTTGDTTDHGTLKTIQRHAQRLLGTLDGVLDIAKIEEGQIPVKRTSIEIRELLAELIVQLQDVAKAEGTWLTLEETPALAEHVVTDARRLRQILLNLIENAIPHCFEHELRLRANRVVDREGGRLDFEVIASGAELTEQQIAQLLSSPKPTCTPSASERLGGSSSSLGLIVSQMLADLLGGSVSIECRAGYGSTFRLELPQPPDRARGTRTEEDEATPAEHLRPGETASTSPASAGSTQSGSLERSSATNPRLGRDSTDPDSTDTPPANIIGRRVLLIDDNPDNLRLVRHFLSRAGARITCCESGPKGIDAVGKAEASGQPFEVVLLDIQMPEMDGHQVAKILRERGVTIPIIAFTAHALAMERERCLRSGFDDYVTKPIDRAALVDIVAHHAERQPDPALCDLHTEVSAPKSFRWSALWERLVHLCTPPSKLGDPSEYRRLNLLMTVSATCIPMILLQAALIAYVFPREVAFPLSSMLLAVIPTQISIMLLYRWLGSAQLPSNLLILFLVCQISSIMWVSGGMLSAASFWLALLPTVAVTLLHRRATLAWTGICIAIETAFLALAESGVELTSHLHPDAVSLSHGLSAATLCVQLTAVMLLHEWGATSASDTLFAANTWLEQARDHSQRAEQAQGAFLANLSRDLQAPLASIIGFADTLEKNWRRCNAPPAQIAPLEAVQRNGHRLRGIIQDLLDYAELEAGRFQARVLPFAPIRVIEETVQSLKAQAASKGLWLHAELTEAIPSQLYGDERRTAQILRCLAENAVKFTSRGGVRISAGTRVYAGTSWFHMQVTDTGPGIPDDQRASLFEPFRQADASKSRCHGGNGLGLALTRQLVTALRGRLQFETEIEQGTSFEVWLPLNPVSGAPWVSSIEV